MTDERITPICKACWKLRYAAQDPLTVDDAKVEICHYCQVNTAHGIYVRINPDFDKYVDKLGMWRLH